MPTVLRYTNVPIETLPAFTTKQTNIFLRDKFSNQCTEYELDTNSKFKNGTQVSHFFELVPILRRHLTRVVDNSECLCLSHVF